MTPITTEAGASRSARLAELVIAHRGGDERAMSSLVNEVTPVLWHVARSYRVDALGAEDIIQTTLLALVRHIEEIEEPRAVLGWLIVTVRRESLRVLRRQERTQPVSDVGADLPAPTRYQPEPVYLATVTQRALWHHVAALPERCQRLLRIVAMVDRPDYAAVARALSMPVGSVGPTRGRCLAKLRTMLATDSHWATS